MENNGLNWFGKASIYQINPRTFSKEGTIAAVTKELPELKKLGFKIMYLCPVFKEDDSEERNFWSRRQKASKTENPKNPYRMNDYFEIDDEYGTMTDLKQFVTRSHELGMRVILDLVYLHIGPNADIFRSRPDFAAKNPDGSPKLTQWNFPYLNYQNEGLREYLYCNMVYYVGAIDVDGFRCDVGDEVPLDFWREGTRRIRTVKPDAVMINEGTKPDYLSVFDANYCFPWHEALFRFLAGEMTASDIIATHRSSYEMTPAGKYLLRDMDNHDTVTDWPFRVEGKYGSDAMEAILALNYTIDGIPMVYCGNEIADTAHLSMFANRFHMGEFEVTDRSVGGQIVDRRKQVITQLNEYQATIPAFSHGSTLWHDSESESVLAFDRVTEGEIVSFVGNFSNCPAEVGMNMTGDMLLSNNAEPCGDKVKLGAYGYVICRVPQQA